MTFTGQPTYRPSHLAIPKWLATTCTLSACTLELVSHLYSFSMCIAFAQSFGAISLCHSLRSLSSRHPISPNIALEYLTAFMLCSCDFLCPVALVVVMTTTRCPLIPLDAGFPAKPGCPSTHHLATLIFTEQVCSIFCRVMECRAGQIFT
ncbi:hypothetical protein F4780DRAFT_274759 [Xylariomycetidae sp. FL0641]|nr:hypothetical protein F4780DRAFT_274759 [Xylariomycetidae sp. FL0641]